MVRLFNKEAFGLANREWNIPNRTDTKFMIGSVSKPLTGVLMLIQVQKGLIGLDKTIDNYLPEFKINRQLKLPSGNCSAIRRAYRIMIS